MRYILHEPLISRRDRTSRLTHGECRAQHGSVEHGHGVIDVRLCQQGCQRCGARACTHHDGVGRSADELVRDCEPHGRVLGAGTFGEYSRQVMESLLERVQRDTGSASGAGIGASCRPGVLSYPIDPRCCDGQPCGTQRRCAERHQEVHRRGGDQ